MTAPYGPESPKLLSLILGFPRPKMEKRWILMLQAFVDESGNGAPDYFVMAGYVSTTEKWLTFINDWQRLLDLNDHPHRPMTRLKMSKMTHDRGLRRAEMFYRVIEENVISAFSVTIDVAGMRKALNEFKWPDWVVEREKLSNPYYFAFQAVADGLAQVQGYFKMLEPVDFVFDDATTKVPCIEGWDLIKTNSSPDVARYLGDTPYLGEKKIYFHFKPRIFMHTGYVNGRLKATNME